MNTVDISSPHNRTLKQWRKLQQSRKERYRRRQLLIEGEKLLTEARKTGCQFHAVLCAETRSLSDEWRDWVRREGIPVYVLSPPLFRDLMETDTPQGTGAVVDMPQSASFDLHKQNSLVLLLDRIQDPGNLGTLLRTAAAAGVTFVGLGKGTVDPYNPKVVRSAAGAIFRIPFRQVDLAEWITRYQAVGGQVVGTAADAGELYHAVRYPERVALLLGNEGNGLASELLRMSDRNVQIPLAEGAESLNVSVAGAVLLYEIVRQRGGVND